jgi:hypothetical protein
VIYITPSLFAGDIHEAQKRWPDAIPCTTAPEAVHAILEGARAVIPEQGWQALTGQILAFWCEPEWIDGLILFAETGNLPIT